jgi:hypothetical protein
VRAFDGSLRQLLIVEVQIARLDVPSPQPAPGSATGQTGNGGSTAGLSDAAGMLAAAPSNGLTDQTAASIAFVTPPSFEVTNFAREVVPAIQLFRADLSSEGSKGIGLKQTDVIRNNLQGGPDAEDEFPEERMDPDDLSIFQRDDLAQMKFALEEIITLVPVGDKQKDEPEDAAAAAEAPTGPVIEVTPPAEATNSRDEATDSADGE